MPALARTSAEAIVAAARALVERDGAEALSMQAVASAVGIKGPSLYKRYADRELLLDDVVRASLQELDEKLAAGRKRADDPLQGMGRAFRAWALKHPRLYPLLFAARPEGFAYISGKMPEVAAPEKIDPPKAKAPLAWIDRFDMRFASGFPVMRGKDDAPLGSARTEVWMRDNPARGMDFLGLMNMSDAFFARPFHVLGRLIQVGTVSMTTYFHCDESDLAEVGEDYVLGAADANIFNKGYADQVAGLWSRKGKLLATSQQMLYFRDKAFVPGGKK